ncbi:hypothetical protein Ait01nite_088370 [Actinoplanes italicus]|uniref:Uncharacterized protein n=1 Tax=Actinoplanes italicus TaxID=113567 RepID=A0A2T0JWK5_9ACTN|nr:hypothetical protein [Actinoplanes italicus]PRX12156.1 hypothetical protein CLV67_12913 [Actinoplanes italicus]GIE35792.1 hypothetical protein Ait01nite_088370 [Actinoplanes italicus]
MLAQFTADGAVFSGRIEFHGRPETVRVARDDLRRLAGYFDERYGPAAGTTVEERLTAVIANLIGRGELREPAAAYWENTERLATHCRRAGIRHVLTRIGNKGQDLTRTYVPLWTATHQGEEWLVSVRVSPTGRGVHFVEGLACPGSPHLLRAHDVTVGLPAFAVLADMIESRTGPRPPDDPCRRAEAFFTGLVAAGEIGPGLAPGEARDRIVAWCAEAGVPHRSTPRKARHDLLNSDRLSLTLSFGATGLHISEHYRPSGGWGSTFSTVDIALADLPALAEHLEQHLGTVITRELLEPRIAGSFATMVSRGLLKPDMPRFGNWGAITGLVIGGGVPSRRYRPLRQAEILHARRTAPGCDYTLNIEIGPTQGIRFFENHEYYARGDDDGAEWSYSVTTEHSALPDLVGHFTSLAGLRPPPAPGLDLEDDLVHYLRELVRTGELTGDLDIEVARDRVAAHFAAAGVAARRDRSHWYNMR